MGVMMLKRPDQEQALRDMARKLDARLLTQRNVFQEKLEELQSKLESSIQTLTQEIARLKLPWWKRLGRRTP